MSDTPKHETCSVCGEMTGRAGRADDSFYTEDGVGPFCESCWASIQPDAAIKLQSELSAANARADALQAELERLEKRELNATIELCYDDGTNPFARETLKVADVGVADNVYVVKSAVVDALQRQVDALPKIRIGKNGIDYWLHMDAPSGKRASINLGPCNRDMIVDRVVQEMEDALEARKGVAT